MVQEKGLVFAGVDIGASRTKVVILDIQKKLLGYEVRKSGVDFSSVADDCLESALAMADRRKSDIARVVSTGYGRENVSFTNDTLTEISCHSKGCYYNFPMAMTVIDIGGQDNKIIKLDANGRRIGFKMNRKCAAGTGAFLEEMSLRLNIPLESMNDLAMQSENTVELGSFCTVFSATEVLERIRAGSKVPDILKGLYLSVIKRVLEMDSLTDSVVVTGGVVAHNPILVGMMEKKIGKKVYVPQYPQLTGAIGAAIFASEKGSE